MYPEAIDPFRFSGKFVLGKYYSLLTCRAVTSARGPVPGNFRCREAT